MPIRVKYKLLISADDSALIISGTDPKQNAEELSKALEECRQWLMDNKFSLHLGKTEAMIFGSKRKLNKVESFKERCGDVDINNVKKVKYLGLVIGDDLSEESTITNILKKDNFRLKFMYSYKNKY